MTVGIYDTATLRRVVEYLPRPQSFLLDSFFPDVETSQDETIVFDVMNGKRRITPFVSPLVAGKVVAGQTYTTNSFKPAYTKDKRPIHPNRGLKRRAGERIGGNLSPEQRIQAILGQELQDQVEMLTRRLEWMAGKALFDGKYTVSGEGFADRLVDFGRDAALSVALLTTARWGETGVSPLKDLETWATLMLKKSGALVTDIVMTPDAYDLLLDDPKTEKALDTTLRGSNAMLARVAEVREGAVYKGALGTYRVWVYNGWYIDEAGSEQPILPAYTVLMSSSDLQGVRHFGAIQDEEAGGLQAFEYFAKSWLEKDPSVRWLLMQSAPLVVPYRPNASFRATVR